MITLHDLNEAIAECYGQRDPTSTTCMKLAAYLTIRNQLYGDEQPPKPEQINGYSFAPADSVGATIEINSDTEFADAANGMQIDQFTAAVEELVEAVQVTNPRLYASFIRKLKSQ